MFHHLLPIAFPSTFRCSLLIWLLLCITFNGRGQCYMRSQLDSLSAEASGQQGVNRVQAYLKLADGFLNFHIDSAQFYAQNAGIESVLLNYEWGIWKSKFLMAQIELSRGNINLSQVRFSKSACIEWFEKNSFHRDVLESKLSLNQETVYTKGDDVAQQQARRLLREAQTLGEPALIAVAWSQVCMFRDHFIDTKGFVEAHDSAQLHFALAKDSLGLVLNACSFQFHQNGDRFEASTVQHLARMAARWKNPTLDALIARMKCFRSAIDVDTNQANLFAQQAKRIESNIGLLRHLPNVSESQSLAYRLAVDYRQVVPIEHELEKRYREQQDTFRLSLAYNRLGGSYQALKEEDRAIHYFLASMRLSETLGDQYTLHSVKRCLARSYVQTNAFGKAELLFAEVIAWVSKQENNRFLQILMGNTLSDLGLMYQAQGLPDEALGSYQAAIDQFHPSNYRSLEPLVQMWSLYLDMGEIHQADSIRQLILSGKLQKEVALSERFFLQEGRLYLAQSQLQKGINSLNSFLAIGVSNAVTEDKKRAHFLRYEAFKALNQNEEALAAFEAFKFVDDSLRARQVIMNVQRIQADYELSMKDVELAQLRQQGELAALRITQQENALELRNMYTSLLVSALLALASMSYLLFKRFQRKKEEQQQTMRNQLAIEHLKAEQKVKLAELKNNLYANMSHELKTPLTLIRVPLMNLQARVHEEDQPLLGTVLKNTDYLTDMLDEVLSVSKMESGNAGLQQAHFDLATTLSQIKLNFAPLFAEKGLHFDWCVVLERPLFFGDEKKLHIVFNIF